ncbi:hypothetical protein, partial [uncultured Flavobacterium sp.]|uniref:hypothetical protein n=1 Tax=uncultured Flavobacterium sp. TaxID=165435 RepID=UPI0025FF0043
DSIVYYVLKWCFISGVIITLLFFLDKWFCDPLQKDLIKNIETIWKIIIPVITLALGYLFGKKTTSK